MSRVDTRWGPVLRHGLAPCLLLLVVTACAPTSGSAARDAATPPAPRQRTVAIAGFDYHPAALEVPPGTRITWRNEDEFGHTVTAGTPDAPTGRFDGTLGETTDGRGRTFSFTFTEPGVYGYFCDFHPSMRATVTVVGG